MTDGADGSGASGRSGASGASGASGSVDADRPGGPAPLHRDRRVVLVVAVLATFVVGLDSSVVNVALPSIGRELGGGIVVQQWTVDAYLVTLGALILVAGSVSDLVGRVRVVTWGLVLFGLASVACAIAPTGGVLVGARAVQGVGGALVTPSSLALVIAAYRGAARARAIGTWTAWSSASVIAGPVIGGVVVDSIGWRWVFVLTAAPIAVTIPLVRRVTGDVRATDRPAIDVVGAGLAVLGVGALVLGLIEQERLGWASPLVVVALAVGVGALAVFVPWERRVAAPLLPLDLFRARSFTVGNLTTLAVYGALGLSGFTVTLFLQEVWGLSAWLAGVATLPPTLVLLGFSTTVGRWSGRTGPRWFMAGGPVLAGLGVLVMLGAGDRPRYFATVFPGMLLMGVGLTLMVAPLTSAVLGSVAETRAGVGSAVNNAVARIASLVLVALAGVVLGADGMSVAGFHRAVVVMAALLVAGGTVSAIGIRNPRRDRPTLADAVPSE
ncbi:MFS transporter [Curtobacterium sp. MCBD17_013]|uniref:MFS transporter n=1 Tax=Curtobacterium sp. MCBD17_013 TaxID=2175668 RepID=UPI000DA8B8EB|nr:MFS transporter [Curtobacterium sp. MCBD17_013]PZF63899.1 MFS transporter [Curtobacterium sp. MCBD17_013]